MMADACMMMLVLPLFSIALSNIYTAVHAIQPNSLIASRAELASGRVKEVDSRSINCPIYSIYVSIPVSQTHLPTYPSTPQAFNALILNLLPDLQTVHGNIQKLAPYAVKHVGSLSTLGIEAICEDYWVPDFHYCRIDVLHVIHR